MHDNDKNIALIKEGDQLKEKEKPMFLMWLTGSDAFTNQDKLFCVFFNGLCFLVHIKSRPITSAMHNIHVL